MLKTSKPPYIGVAYYPEVFGEELFSEDIQRLHEAGVNCVRIAEFAWSTIEREEGVFDFSLFHKIVDRLYEEEIAVVLCTPSATPPKWLTDKYPDTLIENAKGEKSQFGARCHVCKSSSKMREKNRIIVEEFCKEFSQHPGVIGWQIDNEIYPYNDGCYCPNCRKRFQEYLKEKYKTIDNINKLWHLRRWSLEYASFSDIIAPDKSRWNHPSLQVEWLKFQSNLIVEYVKEQAEIIRKYFSVPVGTDMMPLLGTDYYDLFKYLDIVQFNHYENESHGLTNPSFWFDFLRPIKEQPFWVTETQITSQGGTVVFEAFRNKGNCYANTWLPLSKGGQANMYWHFRAHQSGHELYWGSLITTQGRFTYPVSEVQKVSREAEKCKDIINNTKIHSDIALVMSTTSWRNLEYAPLLEKYVPTTPFTNATDSYIWTLKENYHKPFLHHNIDIIDTPHSLDSYKVLITPFLTNATEHNFKERVLAWVENGGTWIVGPLTDTLTDYAAKYLDSPTSFLEEVAGVYLEYQIPGDSDKIEAKWENGDNLKVSKIFEGYKLRGAKSIAKFTNHYLEGLSVITEKTYGKGKIIVQGSVLDEETIKKLVGLPPILLASDNLEVTKRTNDKEYIFINELLGKSGSIELDEKYIDLLTDKILSGTIEIDPYQVLVLEKIK